MVASVVFAFIRGALRPEDQVRVTFTEQEKEVHEPGSS